ncbi:MAG: GumC family protein, partial [Sandaracinobacteroides sp.]
LRELLAGTSSYDDVRVEDPVGGAHILPLTGERRPGERLMDEGRLQSLVARLRESHELVLLDCSPLLPIAEARELAGLADSVVVVARWRKTPDTAVRSALKLLPWAVLSDVGVVLNAIDLRRQARFGRTDPVGFYRQYQNYFA